MDKMLVVADLENSCFATPRGLELALKLGQQVEVVAFVYVPLASIKVTASKRESLRKLLLSEREKVVRARIEKYRQPDQKVDLTVVWEKNIDRWLNKQCADGRYTMVVKTGHRSESLVYTSTDWQLLRECPVPVLLVAKKKWHKVKPVMVALDLSTKVAAKRALNHKVLGMAKSLAQALDVGLHIQAVIEIPKILTELDLVDPLAFERDARESMQPQIKKLAAAYDIPESSFHSKRGPVERVLASRAAKVRAQIVVMGTVARKGVKARLLGNTAEKVLEHLKTDVLAIKP
jgi:universal stress protein E